MTEHQFSISYNSFEKYLIIAIAVIILAMIVLGFVLFLHYEGYMCKTTETKDKTLVINAWCGHNGKLITNSTGSFWYIEGWNFGDFP